MNMKVILPLIIWYNNISEIIPEVITGDMHVIHKAIFAIMKCFEVELKPRFTNLNDQLKNLYCANDIKEYANFLIKPIAQIDLKVIIEQKSSIDQLVATLALKEMNQSNLIKKLCHLPPENNLRKGGLVEDLHINVFEPLNDASTVFYLRSSS
jgi:TnpA family transposase